MLQRVITYNGTYFLLYERPIVSTIAPSDFLSPTCEAVGETTLGSQIDFAP